MFDNIHRLVKRGTSVNDMPKTLLLTKFVVCTVLWSVLFGAGPIYAAGKDLSGKEIRKLLIGHRMTFESTNYKGEAHWIEYGRVILTGTYLGMTGTVERSWRVNTEGRYCRTLMLMWGEKCSRILEMGGKKYSFVSESGKVERIGLLK